MTSYAQHLIEDGYVVFLLHGVIRTQAHSVRNYTRKHLPLDDFTVFLRGLKSAGTPISLSEVVEATANRTRLPPRAFAITFDDGFENNASIAAPVLDDMKIPACFYLTTRFVDEGAGSWIDLIEHAVEHSGVEAIDVAGERMPCATRGEKIAVLDRVRRLVKNDRAIDPYAFAADMRARLGVTANPADAQLDEKMTWEQARQLEAHPRFLVGGHSHTHRILAFLQPAELHAEIATSLELLRKNLRGPITHYSYPEGLAHCYSPAVIESLRSEGIVCCPTAEHGVNRVGEDLFRLKRIMVV
jgi:peptidoglycan/xylan/chitin deacetylase (PgdA/CDA1 family)